VKVDDADGKPKEVQAKHELEQQMEEEANVKISVHARLPACFDQELLDFVSALVKVTKVVELEKEPSMMDEKIHGIKEFGTKLKGSMNTPLVDGKIFGLQEIRHGLRGEESGCSAIVDRVECQGHF
jgi:hypothetical protein